MSQVEAALARVKTQLGAEDYALFRGLFDTVLAVSAILQSSRAMLSRLRRLFGLQSSERSRSILNDSKITPSEDESLTGKDDNSAADEEPKRPRRDPKPPRKGHGRLAASEYKGATQVSVRHETLKCGDGCPGCRAGSLYTLKEPAQRIRIVGGAALSATCWNLERLRCGACGHVYTARPPPEAQGPKFDESAVAMIALCRYGVGLPHHRLARMQKHLDLPVPASTQWDLISQHGQAIEPVFAELERHAAQGEVLHGDDTYARLLSLMGKRRTDLLQAGELPDAERTGLFTTGIVSIANEQPLVLFYTGRKYAGENLAALLEARDDELEPPTLMSDGLESRNLPKGHTVVESSCLAHARRGAVDQLCNFPTECRHVIEQLREVYRIDGDCKKKRLSPQERLFVHQRDSAPIMKALKEWLEAELEHKRVEPNSELGKAYKYMLKRWEKLTLFLRKQGAPLDNNTCERALKMAIRHRRASLFYRSERGARIGDMFMSLIYTAEARKQNPFEYLTAILRNAKAAAERPAQWLPWTYRATLAGDASR